MNSLQQITDDPTYKRVLADSFGGVMYNAANRDKYDSTQLLQAWDNLTDSERESAGGIVKGAMNFLAGK